MFVIELPGYQNDCPSRVLCPDAAEDKDLTPHTSKEYDYERTIAFDMQIVFFCHILVAGSLFWSGAVCSQGPADQPPHHLNKF